MGFEGTHCVRFNEILNHREVNLDKEICQHTKKTMTEKAKKPSPFGPLCLRVVLLRKIRPGQPEAQKVQGYK